MIHSMDFTHAEKIWIPKFKNFAIPSKLFERKTFQFGNMIDFTSIIIMSLLIFEQFILRKPFSESVYN